MIDLARNVRTSLAALTCAAGVCGAAVAQAPANDECTGATPIALDEVAFFDTTNATNSTQPVNAAECDLVWGTTNKDVWMVWVAPQSMNINVTTCDPSSFDTELVVYRGTCDALVQIACNGDAPGSGTAGTCQQWYSRIDNLWVTGGTTYYFRIGGFNGTASGIGSLFISQGFVYQCVQPAYPNDCAPNAQAVTANGFFTVQGSPSAGVFANTDGPDHPGTQCDSGNDQFFLDRWYRFTPSVTALVKTWTTGPSGTCDGILDLKLAIYDLGTDPASFNYSQLPGALVECTDGGGPCSGDGGIGAGLETLVRAGNTYLIRVAWFDADEAIGGTTQRLYVELPEPCVLPAGTVSEQEPCGDNFNGGCNTDPAFPPVQQVAIGDEIAGTFWSTTGSTGGLTRDTDWYQFSVTSESQVTLELRSGTPSTVLLYNAECGAALTSFGASEGFCPSSISRCLNPGIYRAVVLPEFSANNPCGGSLNDYRLKLSAAPADCPLDIATNCEAPGPDTFTVNNSIAVTQNWTNGCAVYNATGGTVGNAYARVFEAGTLGGEIQCLSVGVFATQFVGTSLFFSDIPLPASVGIYRDIDGGAPRWISADDGADGNDLVPIDVREVSMPGGVYLGVLNYPSPVCIADFAGENIVVLVQYPNLLFDTPAGIPEGSGYIQLPGANSNGPAQNTYWRPIDFCGDTGELTLNTTTTRSWVVVVNGNFTTCAGAACPADLNDDGTVDGIDLGILLGAWGACPN